MLAVGKGHRVQTAQSPAPLCLGASLEHSVKRYCRIRFCEIREKSHWSPGSLGAKHIFCNGNAKMQNENDFNYCLNEKWAEKKLSQWYKKCTEDFTVFSNRALIKELKKCGVELEYVQHVSCLFFWSGTTIPTSRHWTMDIYSMSLKRITFSRQTCQSSKLQSPIYGSPAAVGVLQPWEVWPTAPTSAGLWPQLPSLWILFFWSLRREMLCCLAIAYSLLTS